MVPRCLFLVCAMACAGGGRARAEPEVAINSHGFQLPASRSRVIYSVPGSISGVTGALEERWGVPWRVTWDRRLDTPRLLRPLGRVAATSPGVLAEARRVLSSGEGIAPDSPLDADVRAFLREVLQTAGGGAALLGTPYIYEAGLGTVMVYPQVTPDGVPVRGASMRAVLYPDGELALIKVFVLRGCPGASGCQEGAAVDGDWAPHVEGKILGSKLQIGFKSEDPGSWLPIWTTSVEVGGEVVEYIHDARSGEGLACRAVRKHFEARGIVLGRCPPPGDIFAGPGTGTYVVSSIGGSLLRDVRGDPVGVTAGDGTFSLQVNSDPVVLLAELERGILVDDGAGEKPTWRPLLRVKPLGKALLPEDLGADDSDGDGVPDVTLSGFETEELLGTFNRSGTQEEQLKKAWWLQCYHHALSMTSMVEACLVKFHLDPTFWPISPLELNPTTTSGVQVYTGPSEMGDGLARITTSTTMDVERRGGAGTAVEVVPTRLLHEVGHHVVRHMTNYGDVDLSDVEEGVADALTGYTTGRCEIGYRGPSNPTATGFRLGVPDLVRSPGRGDVGDAFWLLREGLIDSDTSDREEGEPWTPPSTVAEILLLQWLAWNRVESPEQEVFEWSASLLGELLETDEFLARGFGASMGLRRHEELILEAFRGRRLFDAPFVRGDANVDGIVNISDAVNILNYLFAGKGTFALCLNGLDTDNNSDINVTDAIYLLSHLFNGGPDPAPPYPRCGLDPEYPGSEGNLGCLDFVCPR